MIAITCASCQRKLSVKDGLAGKKVQCPGCRKPLAGPQPTRATLAGPVKPPAAGLDEDGPSQRGAPARAEGRTLPPNNRTGKESLADAGRQTVAGAGRKGEPTRSYRAPEPSPELWDFLAPAQQPDELGRLGPYRILKVLGAGGMGVVFLAEDPALKRQLAVKAMLPALAVSDTARQRFLREAQTAAALSHDHIVPIFQVGEDRGVPFIAMPFLKGEPLDERLKRDQALPVAEVLRIGREAAMGLGAAHAAGLVHRDIKPANLWLEGEAGRVKILDFGLARAAAANAQLTQQGMIVGTPAYMAPEQAAGQALDGRCDLFSLGCVLYRACTGRPAFDGADVVATLVAVATETPRPPIELRPELPRALSDLVVQLLAKKPDERPESAQAVVEALQNIEAGATTTRPGHKTLKAKARGTTRAEAARTRPGRSARKRPPLRWLVGGGVLCLGVVGLLLLFLLRPGDDAARRGRQIAETDASATKPTGPAAASNRDDRPGAPTAKEPGGQPPAAPEKSEGSGSEADRAGADWVLGLGGVVSVDLADGGAHVQVFPQFYGGFGLSSDDGKLHETVAKLADANSGFNSPQGFVLRHVNLWGRKVTDAGLQHLKGLKGLQTLNLAYTAVSNQGLEHLRGLTGLMRLRLNNTAVNAEGARRLQEALPQCAISTEPALSYPKLAAGPWTAVLSRKEDVQGQTGVNFVNGTLEITTFQRLFVPSVQGQDMAIRARVKKVGGQNLGLILRSTTAGWRYTAYFDGDKVFGMGQHKPGFVNFIGVATPKSYTDFFELTFAASGDTLAVFVDGEQIMEYRDPRPESGGAGITALNGPAQFKQIEVKKLK